MRDLEAAPGHKRAMTQVAILALIVLVIVLLARWGDPGPGQVVFVTSERFTGDLGGLAGADAACARLAAAAGLDGEFAAWLSGGEAEPAAVRLGASELPYRLVTDAEVATAWPDLADGFLGHAINQTEGGEPPAGRRAWTNTAADGSAADPGGACAGSDGRSWTCDGAGCTGDPARAGLPETVSPAWTSGEDLPCSERHHLYCVER